MKVLPTPSSLSIVNLPPCRCKACLTIASPSPVPPLERERPGSTRLIGNRDAGFTTISHANDPKPGTGQVEAQHVADGILILNDQDCLSCHSQP